MALSGKSISGWLIQYNKLSLPLPNKLNRTIKEIVLPDAFAESVAAINAGQYQIEANIEHTQDNALMRLGKTDFNVKLEHRSGQGVWGTIEFVGNTVNDDLFANIQSGLVRGLSIEFGTDGNEPAFENVNGTFIRKIGKGILTGFAIVAKPAYPDAKIVEVNDTEAVFQRSLDDAASAELEKEVKAFEHQEYLKLQTQKTKLFLAGIRF